MDNRITAFLHFNADLTLSVCSVCYPIRQDMDACSHPFKFYCKLVLLIRDKLPSSSTD